MKNFVAIDFETANYRLPTVCAYLGIPFDRHHYALADAEGCARIALRLWGDEE